MLTEFESSAFPLRAPVMQELTCVFEVFFCCCFSLPMTGTGRTRFMCYPQIGSVNNTFPL